MASFSSAQQTMGGIQQAAQEALPVIPNNGNPAGAYNMPQAAQPMPKPVVGQAQPMAKPTLAQRYPWLQSSPSLQNARDILAQRRQGAGSPVMPTRGMTP